MCTIVLEFVTKNFFVVGELSGQGAELLVRFRTSARDRPQYTIRTHGDCDMVIALLGPDDYTNVIK